jgi:hypothetical protein
MHDTKSHAPLRFIIHDICAKKKKNFIYFFISYNDNTFMKISLIKTLSEDIK